MKIEYGNGSTVFGPGINIELEGDEVATAIDAWLVAHNVYISGSRTIRVNGRLIENGEVYIDPSGFVIVDGKKLDGRGESASGRIE